MDGEREDSTLSVIVEERKLRPATEEEKKLLRNSKLVRPATGDEVEAFLVASAPHLSVQAKTAFYAMNPENQYRVMYEGPLTECSDSTEILYARVQRFMDMENQLKKLANADTTAKEAKKPKQKKTSELAMAIGRALVSTVPPEEVPEGERRFATPAAGGPPRMEPKAAAPLEGSIKGVGGVIEALQKKYSMQKGERLRVIAETKELWKLEGEKTVPKTQCNQGWKWVLKGAEEAAEREAAERLRKKREAEDRRTQEVQDRNEVEEKLVSKDKDGKSAGRKSMKDKSRMRSSSSSRRCSSNSRLLSPSCSRSRSRTKAKHKKRKSKSFQKGKDNRKSSKMTNLKKARVRSSSMSESNSQRESSSSRSKSRKSNGERTRSRDPRKQPAIKSKQRKN